MCKVGIPGSLDEWIKGSSLGPKGLDSLGKQQRTKNGMLKTLAGPDNDGRPAYPIVDQDRIRTAVREILLAIGEDPDREGLLDTPDRVARMYAELFSGLKKDPRELLQKKFTQKYDEMVLEKNIAFESVCEHHLLPFLGKGHIAYLP